MSTLKVNAIQNTSGVEQYLAKAWVNFNGTGTVAITASGNVTSITDNGTGDYTVNLTSALTDGNYSVVGTCNSATASSVNRAVCVAASTPGGSPTTKTSSAVRLLVGASVLEDNSQVNVAIFR